MAKTKEKKAEIEWHTENDSTMYGVLNGTQRAQIQHAMDGTYAFVEINKKFEPTEVSEAMKWCQEKINTQSH